MTKPSPGTGTPRHVSLRLARGLQQLAEAQEEIHNPGQQAQASQTAESARDLARQRMLRKHLLRKKRLPQQPAAPA